MGILNRNEIIRRIQSFRDYAEKLVITPLLSEEQIGPASVDIRLGSSIIVPKRTYVESQDVTDEKIVRQVERRRCDRIRLRYHSKFVLHPNELILASTFEYISLPADVFCTIATRSSWGRLGLVIATASVVQPGYKGCLTLELVNVSYSPIVLYPGLLIGQLVFSTVVTPPPGPADTIVEQPFYPYAGRYSCPTEAELPRFYSEKTLDAEMGFWREKGQNTD